MPVLINHKRCNCLPNCFAANVCPKNALYVDRPTNLVTVKAEVCGDCPAPCLNFCDRAALKYAPSLVELDIMARELAGEITVEQAIEERKQVAARLKAEAEAKVAAAAEAELHPIKFTQENFMTEVAQSELPVLVDFWAEWCEPCKQITPILEEFVKTFAGKLKIGKLNVDEEPDIAGQLRVQSIPTLVIFFQGQIADMIVGALPKPQLQARVQRVLEAVAQLQAQQPTKGTAAPPPAAPPSRPAANRPGGVAPSNLPPQPPRRPRGH